MRLPGLLLASLLGAVLLAACDSERHCVVIDAGSSGSRLHVYSVSSSRDGGLPRVARLGGVLKNHEPLSAFAARPQAAAATLGPLLAHARQQVPAAQQAGTPVHLLATAGLRLVPPGLAAAVLDACRPVLAASGFRFRPEWAAMLPGSSEGIFGFVAANYASGALQQRAARRGGRRERPQPLPAPLLGVLELGGASLQVTFLADPEAAAGGEGRTRRVALGGLELSVFTHSFLGLGQDAAQAAVLRLAAARLPAAAAAASAAEELAGGPAAPAAQERVSDPCLPLGFTGEVEAVRVSGGGYFGLCRQVAAGLLLGNCTGLRCRLGGLFLPPLTGQFLGIENLQYTAAFLGLPAGASLRQLMAAGQGACATPWPELLARFPAVAREHLLRYCFGAAYAVALLHDALGVGLDDRSTLFTDAVRDPAGTSIVLDWTLGAVVVAAAAGGELAGLDREFPTAEVGRRRAEARGDWSAQVGLLGLGVLVALVFCLLNDRQRRRVWKRKRRRLRPPKPGAEAEAGEESATDGEGAVPLTSRVDGRQLVPRSCDVEQGLAA